MTPGHSCELILRKVDWKTKAKTKKMVQKRAEKSGDGVESFSSKFGEDSLTLSQSSTQGTFL